MRKKLLFMLVVLATSIGIVQGQSRQISGRVLDNANNDPLPGVSVTQKGTQNATMTDADGNFTISVSQNATLVITSIGYITQEVTARNDMSVNLVSDETVLDPVMVVAYGTAKRSQFTGSATVVTSDEIGKIQTANIADALVGKVTGMQIANASGQPGATSPTIRVRGITSINAGNNPLVIVDGAPYDGDLNNLNPADVESVTVLKDAASNALYGSRAANGVMMITTKKGNKSGDAKVTVDAKWGYNTRATQDYKYIKSPAQYYEMYFGALKNYFIDQGTPVDLAQVYANMLMINNGTGYGLGYNVYNVPSGENLIGPDGKLNPNATLGNVVTYKGQQYTLLPDNWLDLTYRQSNRQEYNVSITGGGDKSNFYTSVGYLSDQGIVPNSDYKRLTGRLKADYQAKPWLKVGGNMLYANYKANMTDEDGNSSSSGNVFATATRMAPIYPMYIRDGNGNIMVDEYGNTRYDYGMGDNAGLMRPYLGMSNPLSDLILNNYSYEGNAVNASGFADITFLKDFKFSSINTVSSDETRSTQYTNPYYGGYASANGMIWKSHERLFSYDVQQLLTYTKDINAHHFDILLGHDYYYRKHFSLSALKSNMSDPSNLEFGGAVVDGQNAASRTYDYMTEGYFARGQYDFSQRYFASLSFRRDASSRFAPENRWGNFWSAGAAWILSQENWFKTSWVNLLKLKASYGQQGNDNIGDFLYTNTYTIVTAIGHPAAMPYRYGNKDITWETASNFNAGIEFQLFKQRFNGGVDYYYRKTSDMLFYFPIAPSFGWTGYYANIGDMRNTGFEIDLSGTPIQTKDFSWNIGANITLQKNKITYLPDKRKTMHISGVDGYSSGFFYYGEGIPLFNYYMYQYAGVNDKGQALYYADARDENGNLTGERETVLNPSDATMYLCGTMLPDAYGGFSTSFNYKGFDLSASFAYQIGGLVYDSDYASAMSVPYDESGLGSAFHEDLLKAWTPDNPNSNIPRFYFGDQNASVASDRFLINASYLSLQNITLGYTISKEMCAPLGIQSVRVYAVCDNVWLWSKRQGLDPRQGITTSSGSTATATSGSSTASYYSPIRALSGGLTITF
ncbi:MAG: TonB-dependent receptor [Paludibacter sp.]|nr:TonB-dependent receptor [Paludibacter sp.]